jgi:predicted transcriptional regulator
MAKEAVFTVKLESELRDAFLAEAEATHRPASQLVRDFMRDFVKRKVEEREHDTWFQAQVREALDTPSVGIPHDVVREETRAIIDRIAAAKAKA